MGRRIYTGTNKKTGLRYRFLGRVVFGRKQYSCDLKSERPQYFNKLSEARQNAEKLGVLSVVAEPAQIDAGSLIDTLAERGTPESLAQAGIPTYPVVRADGAIVHVTVPTD